MSSQGGPKSTNGQTRLLPTPARAVVWPATTTATGLRSCHAAMAATAWSSEASWCQSLQKGRKEKVSHTESAAPKLSQTNKTLEGPEAHCKLVTPAMGPSSSGSRKVGRRQPRRVSSRFLTISDLQPDRVLGGVWAVGAGRREVGCGRWALARLAPLHATCSTCVHRRGT